MAASSTTVDNTCAQRMLKFINYAWTPYHAVEAMSKKLLAAGYKHLSEKEEWSLQPGGKYFFTRNMSTIVAFAVGAKYEPGNGVYMLGAHTDSPCLKLKPVSKSIKAGCLMVNCETYGGGLWSTWFDRDLSVAGRVLVRGSDGALEQKLVKIERPILRIPMLAIHLNRTINSDGFKPNPQTELVPLLATQVKAQLGDSAAAPGNGTTGGAAAHHSALLAALADAAGCAPADIVDLELNVCDTQPGQIGGLRDEFVLVGRLDNLAMSWTCMQALIDTTKADDALAEEAAIRAVALFDHEEVGSSSATGAGGPVMRDTITRAARALGGGARDVVERALQRSFLVSADMAHALHPNYTDKHEPDHKPQFHGGLVLKYNQNQRYATNAVTATLFKEVAERRGIPYQAFVVRNDVPCGSTIGPILASGLGVRTIDVGIPQYAMHSVREMCGTDDIAHAYNHFVAFFEEFGAIDSTLDVDSCMVVADGEIDDVPCECTAHKH